MADDLRTAELPLVSILFITYNRAHTLVATFESFVRRVTYPRERMEFILCDDASDPWHRAISDQLGFDRILRSDRNRGLGANHNAGLRAAQGDYILSLQDDCMLVGDPDFLSRSIAVLEADPALTMIGFRQRPNLPSTKRRTSTGETLMILGTAPNARECNDYAYSDQPHVKRSMLHQRVGLYLEGVPMTKMETEFQRRVAADETIQVAALDAPDPFIHIGSSFTFNEANLRAQRLGRTYRLPVVGPLYQRLRICARRLLRGA